ncbi:MAG TPA: ATPase, T2SS/T4P/T4SS family [Acidobacteriota bacterium]|nr:ATPase, T2SS/T4P/T4SS family [Acidobacteriota bacterium]
MKEELLATYTIKINDIVVNVRIIQSDAESVPQYISSVANISEVTKVILEKIREEFISNVNLGKIHFDENSEIVKIRDMFRQEVEKLLDKYFPGIEEKSRNMLMNYIISQDLGLGDLEILLKDDTLEEIVVNGSQECVWIFHRQFGWCKTNLKIQSEKQIRHYSTMIGRDVNKEITLLSPLMDAHLSTGDRINATLYPISTRGNTMTIRKFAKDPWTITDFLRKRTISHSAAALVWLAIENELSVLIVGGTGSGKTSMLNVLANFFPPNQRIISIEDTRELMLPGNLHWVPMETRMANPEGKGEVTMLDLLVNSLRMRPDRIIVGEIRRREEAEILMEAMHTGHSVYGTFHANTADEAIVRMCNPPINLPKPMLSALSLFLVQNRNRRNGLRRTFQIAEILQSGDANVMYQLDVREDDLRPKNESKVFRETLKLYTGMSDADIDKNIAVKIKILKWLVERNIRDVNKIGQIMAEYYRGKLVLT